MDLDAGHTLRVEEVGAYSRHVVIPRRAIFQLKQHVILCQGRNLQKQAFLSLPIELRKPDALLGPLGRGSQGLVTSA